MFTYLKIWIAETMVMKPEVMKEMRENTMNQDKKYVLSLSPIIFIPSLDFDSFSAATLDVT